MWLTPGALGPRGLSPATIDFVGLNETGAALNVGEVAVLDFKKSVATDYNAGSATGAFYVLVTPSGGNLYNNYAVPAILIGDTKGTGTSVADGEEGLFRLVGKVKDAAVLNQSDDATDAGNSLSVPAGTWVVPTTTNALSTSDSHLDTSQAGGPKIVGFLLEATAAGAVADTQESLDIMFNGYGLGTLVNTDTG